MFRTLSLDKAIGCNPNIIQHGILHLSNDCLSCNSAFNSIVNDLTYITNFTSYSERLDLWIKNKICVTEIWLGDTSTLVERGSDVKYKTEFGRPKVDTIFTVYPTSVLEVLELNLRNIAIAIEYLGSFEQYKNDYKSFLEEHKDSLFLIDRITKDIDIIEQQCTTKGYYGFSRYNFDVVDWYEAFKNKQESLTLNDYKIWINLVKEVTLFSSRNSNTIPRKMLYLLDQSRDVINAANGYSFCQILPFLEVIRTKFIQKLFPESETTDTQPQGSEQNIKLQWNGSNRVLYDLFAQLTLIDTKPGERLIGNSIKELARFLSDHVEGLPTATTIERELEKMREPFGIEKVKRGRIELHLTRDDS